jgi:hypothetical protein
MGLASKSSIPTARHCGLAALGPRIGRLLAVEEPLNQKEKHFPCGFRSARHSGNETAPAASPTASEKIQRRRSRDDASSPVNNPIKPRMKRRSYPHA